MSIWNISFLSYFSFPHSPYHHNPAINTQPCSILQLPHLSLAAGAPDILEVTVTLSKAVEGVIALATGTDKAAESVGLILTSVATVFVDLPDGNLNRGVVVGLDDAVGGTALAGDVAAFQKTQNQSMGTFFSFIA